MVSLFLCVISILVLLAVSFTEALQLQPSTNSILRTSKRSNNIINNKCTPINMSISKDCRKFISVCITASSLSLPMPYPAAAAVSSPLETAIVTLEKSETRGDTLQSLADVFEAAGSKTLLARTKYKYRIINAINEKQVKLSSEWDQALNYASRELKRRADPFRTVDLSSFLSIAPYTGAAAYIGALFVQQALPELFVFAYPLAAASIVLPIVYVILST